MDKGFFVGELEAHSGMLYRVAYTILRNDETCKDALQDTALKAWEKRHSLREERYFRTWATRILINVLRHTEEAPPNRINRRNTRAFCSAARSGIVTGAASTA